VVGLCAAAPPLGVGAGVVAPEPDEELLDEPEPDDEELLDEPEALGAGVDDAVDAHEAEVGRSTPFALHKAPAAGMIASDLVSRTGDRLRAIGLAVLLCGVARLVDAAGETSDQSFVSTDAFEI
jgi:hypothetical protein